jgi:hypothetical protein
MEPISTLLLANIYKASVCHVERRKTKRKGMEAAIIAVLADKGGGLEPIPTLLLVNICKASASHTARRKTKR